MSMDVSVIKCSRNAAVAIQMRSPDRTISVRGHLPYLAALDHLFVSYAIAAKRSGILLSVLGRGLHSSTFQLHLSRF